MCGINNNKLNRVKKFLTLYYKDANKIIKAIELIVNNDDIGKVVTCGFIVSKAILTNSKTLPIRIKPLGIHIYKETMEEEDDLIKEFFTSYVLEQGGYHICDECGAPHQVVYVHGEEMDQELLCEDCSRARTIIEPY